MNNYNYNNFLLSNLEDLNYLKLNLNILKNSLYNVNIKVVARNFMFRHIIVF